VLTRLPALRSGADPRAAFAGTFHIDEAYRQLQVAYDEAAGGQLPSGVPAEIYCHTLTDPSILAPELVANGWHTLTLFGLHTPARLFADGKPDDLADRYLNALNTYLAEPIQDCLAIDADGKPCVEAKTPRRPGLALGGDRGRGRHLGRRDRPAERRDLRQRSTTRRRSERYRRPQRGPRDPPAPPVLVRMTTLRSGRPSRSGLLN
jgi:hypothetical protein